MPDAKRIDIISDTHGFLSRDLRKAIRGADLIIHAGDITSEDDYEQLKMMAPVHAVLGNNDGFYDYGPEVERLALFNYEGLSFAVSHYREDLPVGSVDVAVCGHTHMAKMTRLGKTLVVNPGSASYPRGMRGATIARLIASGGQIVSCDIIDL